MSKIYQLRIKDNNDNKYVYSFSTEEKAIEGLREYFNCIYCIEDDTIYWHIYEVELDASVVNPRIQAIHYGEMDYDDTTSFLVEKAATYIIDKKPNE